MSIRGKAHIVGAYEHPERRLPDSTVPLIHAQVVTGALADAGLTLADVDGFFCDSTVGFGPISMADYLGLHVSYADSTEIGGSSYVAHVGHAATAIAEGKCSIALVSLAGIATLGGAGRPGRAYPEGPFENVWGLTGPLSNYALAARRHMYEFGTTSAQLAEIKVAASLHAQHNPNAVLQNPVTVEEVLDSPMICDPLHRLDCCVVTDGGGAVVVVSAEIARDLAAAEREGARSRRSVEAHRQRARRHHVQRRTVVGTACIRRGGRAAFRHRLRVDLRLVHHHRPRVPRGSRLLRKGRRRQLRARRRAASHPTAGFPSTPMVADCATTTPATGVA